MYITEAEGNQVENMFDGLHICNYVTSITAQEAWLIGQLYFIQQSYFYQYIYAEHKHKYKHLANKTIFNESHYLKNVFIHTPFLFTLLPLQTVVEMVLFYILWQQQTK